MSTATAPIAYSIPQEFEDFRETIRKMVVEKVAPRAGEIDETAEYPTDIRELFAGHDLMGLPFDDEHGGTGTGTLMLNIAVEEVAKACASSALILMVQELGTLPITLFGSGRAQAAIPAQMRVGRVVAGVRAFGARRRLGSRRDADPARSATATSG